MPWIQFAVMALVSAIFTIPVVLLFPRQRTSPAFDRFLWIGTWLLGFLCAWLAIGYVGTSSLEPVVAEFDIGQLPLVAIIVGAGAGVFVLNALLWLLDRFSPPEVGEEDALDFEEPLDGQDGSGTPEEPKEPQEQQQQ